jgi:uncharacterized alpha-E superfamily protein
MVAARAPVIDLVALDPNNPRSMVHQLARIEAHLAALPKGDDGRLSPPEQVATVLTARLRTADVAALDVAVLLEAEGDMMRLSDAIGSTYFTTQHRSEAHHEAHA